MMGRGSEEIYGIWVGLDDDGPQQPFEWTSYNAARQDFDSALKIVSQKEERCVLQLVKREHSSLDAPIRVMERYQKALTPPCRAHVDTYMNKKGV